MNQPKKDHPEKCELCGHAYHVHPLSPYAESSRCGVEKYPDHADPEPCQCRAGKTEIHEGWKMRCPYEH